MTLYGVDILPSVRHSFMLNDIQHKKTPIRPFFSVFKNSVKGSFLFFYFSMCKLGIC